MSAYSNVQFGSSAQAFVNRKIDREINQTSMIPHPENFLSHCVSRIVVLDTYIQTHTHAEDKMKKKNVYRCDSEIFCQCFFDGFDAKTRTILLIIAEWPQARRNSIDVDWRSRKRITPHHTHWG